MKYGVGIGIGLMGDRINEEERKSDVFVRGFQETTLRLTLSTPPTPPIVTEGAQSHCYAKYAVAEGALNTHCTPSQRMSFVEQC